MVSSSSLSSAAARLPTRVDGAEPVVVAVAGAAAAAAWIAVEHERWLGRGGFGGQI